jgi:monovalent cation/hydrogen antiporter
LVVLGTVVAAFAGRLRVPAPSLLVIAGLAVGLLPRFPPVHVPPDVVSLVVVVVVVVVLPPLLYAARWMSQLATPGLVMEAYSATLISWQTPE